MHFPENSNLYLSLWREQNFHYGRLSPWLTVYIHVETPTPLHCAAQFNFSAFVANSLSLDGLCDYNWGPAQCTGAAPVIIVAYIANNLQFLRKQFVLPRFCWWWNHVHLWVRCPNRQRQLNIDQCYLSFSIDIVETPATAPVANLPKYCQGGFSQLHHCLIHE